MNGYCPLDGFGLDDEGECPRCEQSAAAEQADDEREDMEWEQ